MTEPIHPVLRQTVLDCPDPRGLAEFYRELLGMTYRPGDEPPPDGGPDDRGRDWLVLRPPAPGGQQLAFQQVDDQARSTWPDNRVPQQLHLDMSVPDVETLARTHESALALGATVLLDRTDDEEEPLWVYADPAGHPFCIFVAPA